MIFLMSTVGNSTNIFWHECAVGNIDRQKLLNQKGCVVWITGLSGSGIYFLLICYCLPSLFCMILLHIFGIFYFGQFRAFPCPFYIAILTFDYLRNLGIENLGKP